jgi:uncharacterized protein YraI
MLKGVFILADQPTYFMQTDARWSSVDYSTKGETTTIGKSGCGPTCMAMLLNTFADKSITPVTTCAWSLAHGYKALNQGTYYTYFKAHAAVYGFECFQLNPSDLRNMKENEANQYHNKALNYIRNGQYVICCMGKGLWTSSGHFIIWYAYDGKCKINDPASTNSNRTNGDYATLKSQVKYYFIFTNPKTVAEDTEITYDATVTVSSLNVRSGPATSYADIGDVYKGQTVKVVSQEGSWYKIKYGGDYGYVCGAYVTDPGLPKTTTTTTTTSTTTATTTTIEEDDDMITQDKFNEMFEVAMNAYNAKLEAKDPDTWSETERKWIEEQGAIKGDTNGKKKYKAHPTREELSVILYRLLNK